MTSQFDDEDLWKDPNFYENIHDKRWRLEHLYYITDKNGNKIKFNLNWAQKILFENFWYQMLILKARQLGCTTFFAISFLDDCFWFSNTTAGIIADKRESSEEIFKRKVKFAYDHMPKWTRDINSAKNDRVGELQFCNGSSYRVSTGFRSGTYTRLLISEFGKICCKTPDVATEIVTGSLNTVSKDEIVVIESTAAGREGFFYDMCKEAEHLGKGNVKLSSMQQRFFFFPWYMEPTYIDESESVIVSKETNEYLDRIEGEEGRKIREEQRRWYEQKMRFLGDSIKQEYPSTASEAFEASNEGLYYGKEIAKLREKGYICRVPYQEYSFVHTAWDIGVDDHTAIWCFQISPSEEIQFINYYENRDEAPRHYIDWLASTKYKFGTHILPHDAANKSAQTNVTYADVVGPMLQGHIVILNRDECNVFLGIQNVRVMLPKCVFDAEKCAKGVKHLESYRKLWDDRLGCYKTQPLHDEHSHCADAMRYVAAGLSKIESKPKSLDETFKALRAYWGG